MDVLEIGSGRGGGCDYIKRYFNPRKITGLDIAVNAVNFSKQSYQQKAFTISREMRKHCRLKMDILM